MESIVLLNWCEQHGFGPLALTGLSMGGHVSFYFKIKLSVYYNAFKYLVLSRWHP